MASAERRPIDLNEGWGAMQVREESASATTGLGERGALSLSLSLRDRVDNAADRGAQRAGRARAWPGLRPPPAPGVPAAPCAARMDRRGARKTSFLTRQALTPLSPPSSKRDPHPNNHQGGIDKLVRLLEDDNEAQFNAEQYMQLYT